MDVKEGEKIRIFKPIRELDAEIRTIAKDKDTKIYYVEVGLFESLGESAGMITTLMYKHMPSKEEIIKDTRDELKEMKKGLSEDDYDYLSASEQKQFKVLKKLRI